MRWHSRLIPPAGVRVPFFPGVTEGDPLEMTNVSHLFIAGEPVNLNSKHTELYEKFSNRPGPRQ
jgi:hypothetical protein